MQRSAAPSQARKRVLGTSVAGSGGRPSQNESSQANESVGPSPSSSRLYKPFKPPSIVAGKHILFKSPLSSSSAARDVGTGSTGPASISPGTPVNVTSGSNKRASDGATPDAGKHLKLTNSLPPRATLSNSAFKPPQPKLATLTPSTLTAPAAVSSSQSERCFTVLW